MARYVFPEPSDRLVYLVQDGLALYPAIGQHVTVYTDPQCQHPAVITDLSGTSISSTLAVDANSLIPRFRGPEGVVVLYTTGGNPIHPETTTPPITVSATPPTNPQVDELWIAVT